MDDTTRILMAINCLREMLAEIAEAVFETNDRLKRLEDASQRDDGDWWKTDTEDDEL